MTNKISFIIVVAGFIIMCFGLYFTLKNYKPIEAVLLVGTIISILALASLYAKYRQDKSSSEKSDKTLATSISTNEKADTIQQQNIDLKQQLSEQDKTIKELRVENVDLYAKLASANMEAHKFMTGGDNFPYVDLRQVKSNGNEHAVYILVNESSTPLYNASFVFIDFDLMKNSTYTISGDPHIYIKQIDYYKAVLYTWTVNEMTVKTEYAIQEAKTWYEGRFIVRIATRNNFLLQKLVIQRIKGLVYFAFQIIKPSGEVIKEQYTMEEEMSAEVKDILKGKLESIPNTYDYLFAD